MGGQGKCMRSMSDPVLIVRPEFIALGAMAAFYYRDAIELVIDLLAIATPWLINVARMRIPAIVCEQN